MNPYFIAAIHDAFVSLDSPLSHSYSPTGFVHFACVSLVCFCHLTVDAVVVVMLAFRDTTDAQHVHMSVGVCLHVCCRRRRCPDHVPRMTLTVVRPNERVAL